MSSITPYRVQVGDDVLDDLSSRLARTRWPDHLEGSGWDMGTEMSWLQEVCEYWSRTTTGEYTRPPSTPGPRA